MTPEAYFTKAKQALNLPAPTTLQSAYQFGAEADKLAALVLAGKKQQQPVRGICTQQMNHCLRLALMA